MRASQSPVIGCDYSGQYIYLALVKGTKVLNTASVFIGQGEDHYSRKEGFILLVRLLKTFKDLGSDYIYIERPLVNAKFSSPLTGMILTRSATYVEIAAMEAELWHEFIPVQTWRKKIFGTARVENAKEAAIKYVKGILGYDPPLMGKRKQAPDHNFCEAVCIAQAGYILQEEMMGKELNSDMDQAGTARSSNSSPGLSSYMEERE